MKRPRLHIQDGTIEAIKWLALLLMTADHCNRYLLATPYQALVDIGRMAMPLFAFTLAYNLSRPQAFMSDVHFRVAVRLLLCGIVSAAIFSALKGPTYGWYPLNILFTFLLSVAIIYLSEVKGKVWFRLLIAVGLFIAGGAIVEFWWMGVAVFLASWLHCKRNAWWSLLMLFFALISLYPANRSLSALAALPLIAAAPFFKFNTPRIKGFFYLYYPLHLAALLLVLKIHGGKF